MKWGKEYKYDVATAKEEFPASPYDLHGKTKHQLVAACEKACEQYVRRVVAAAKETKKNNADLYAGSPMFYYCRECGIFIEKLPEDYLFPPHSRCSQCEGLNKMGWLTLAKKKAGEVS